LANPKVAPPAREVHAECPARQPGNDSFYNLGATSQFSTVRSEQNTCPREILAWEWASGEKKSRKRVEELLAQAGLSWEDVDIRTLSRRADELEQLDAREELWGKRRDTILQQIERRRAGWAKQVRRSSEDIVEAEFREIRPLSPDPEASSVPSGVEAAAVSSGGENSKVTQVS
jgi:hypothetical protein